MKRGIRPVAESVGPTTFPILNGYVVAVKDGDTAIHIGPTVITFTDAGGHTIYEKADLPLGLEMVKRLKETGHF